MSRQARLPPRCPLQRKTVAPIPKFSVLPPSSEDIELDHQGQYRHYRSVSQSSILEEQPPWLNDLLSDSDSSSNGTFHRRASSDSSTLLEGLAALPNLDQLHEKEAEDDGPGPTCMYGPNSPRRKKKLGFPEHEIVSAFSEYVSCSGVLQSDPFRSDQNISGSKPVKRHPGQRSRARKLQYIAELEKTVDVLQNVGSELAVRVASLIQQFTALSMENNTLKQQLLRMKQEKFILDGEYESLMKELERLRTGVAISTNNKNHKNHNRSRPAGKFARSDAMWHMLDMRKLDLN